MAKYPPSNTGANREGGGRVSGGLRFDIVDHALKGRLCGRFGLIDDRVLRLLYILLQALPKIGVGRWRAKPRQIRGQFRSSSLDLELETANFCVAQCGPPFPLESRGLVADRPNFDELWNFD